jgi:hypothetical protein
MKQRTILSTLLLYQRCKAESKAGVPNMTAMVKEGTTDGE